MKLNLVCKYLLSTKLQGLNEILIMIHHFSYPEFQELNTTPFFDFFSSRISLKGKHKRGSRGSIKILLVSVCSFVGAGKTHYITFRKCIKYKEMFFSRRLKNDSWTYGLLTYIEEPMYQNKAIGGLYFAVAHSPWKYISQLNHTKFIFERG